MTVINKKQADKLTIEIFAEQAGLIFQQDGKSFRLLKQHESGLEEVVHVHVYDKPDQWALDVLWDVLESYD